MEPSLSLQSHIFSNLEKVTYRDINIYNPLNVTHPPPAATYFYLTEVEKSPIGDGQPSSINLIVPQDCGGFNLGSFFIRRSAWSERLLDVWWDPVSYGLKHMDWEHKEQDALVCFNSLRFKTIFSLITSVLRNIFIPISHGSDRQLRLFLRG